MPLDMAKLDPAMQAPLGHNRPPSAAELLRQDLEAATEGLRVRRDELLAAVERVPPEVDSDDLAGKVADFVKQLMAVHKAAEAARVGAKEPHLEASRVVDGYFKAITEPLFAAKQKIEARLTLWQRKKAEEERRRREAEERARRKEADRQAKEAADAAKAAVTGEGTVDQAITSDALARQAEADVEAARKSAAAKPAELSRTRGDYGATASLRTFWDFRDLDRAALDLERLREHLPIDALEKAVRAHIKAGGRVLKGVEIFENTHSVVR